MLKKNIIANLLGKGISALLAIVFVPFYLKYLGAEAYGLVGLFAVLQSVFMLADMGLSGTFTRETARLSVTEDNAQQMRDLCRTFEGIFATVGLLVALVVAASSHLIAEHWVNLEQLSVTTVSSSILLIGVAVGLQFPFFIYQGGMQGLQRQTLLNGLLVGLSLLRGLGAVLILKFVDPSIQAFFIWQVAISVIQLIAGRLLIWRSLPAILATPRFNFKLIFPLWRFAAGTAGITLSGILLTQSDKLVLTNMLPLQIFGYYTLAGVVSSVPGIIAFPVSNAIYPRFIQLVAIQNFSELTNLYHRSCQLVSVLIIPVGLVLALFSKEIMLLWTGSELAAQNSYLLVSVLVTASTLMGLMLMPYALQLAFAWTRLSLIFNFVGTLLLIPSMIFFVARYGALGATFMWLLLNSAYVLIMIYLMHKKILQGEKYKWYVDDIGKPFISTLLVVLCGYLIFHHETNKVILIAELVIILGLSTLIAGMSVRFIRIKILAVITKVLRQVCLY